MHGVFCFSIAYNNFFFLKKRYVGDCVDHMQSKGIQIVSSLFPASNHTPVNSVFGGELQVKVVIHE